MDWLDTLMTIGAVTTAFVIGLYIGRLPHGTPQTLGEVHETVSDSAEK